jgi:hypothetical protein
MLSEISISFYFSDSDSSNKDESDSKNAFVCKIDKNIFLQTAITLYDRKDMKNDRFWEQFNKNFAEWTEDDFKTNALNICLRRLRNVLRKRNVWILKNAKMIIAKVLI